MGQFDAGEQLAARTAKRLTGIQQLMGHVTNTQVGEADRRGNRKHHGRNQPRHHAQAKQGQGRDEVHKRRHGLHQVQHRAHARIHRRFMRGDNAQRHTDDHADKGGKHHLREGFHGLLPIPQVEDQQKRQRNKDRKPPLALNQVGKQRDQPDKRQRVEPGQRKRHAMDHGFECGRNGIEDIGAMFGQPVDEVGDVLAQRDFVIYQHGMNVRMQVE